MTKINDEDCNEIRRMARNAKPMEDIGKEFDKHGNTIRHHAYGKCQCDSQVDPVEPEYRRTVLTSEDCDEIRRRLHEGATMRGVAKDFDITHTAISYHGYGKCNCDNSVTRIPDREYAVSNEECQRYRRKYQNVNRIEDIETERSYGTIRNHVFGRCDHDGDLEPAETHPGFVKITEEICQEITYLYVIELYSFGEIDDMLKEKHDISVGRSTLKKHIFRECDHSLNTD